MKTKKFLSTFMVVFLLLTQVAFAKDYSDYPQKFWDVTKDHWAYEYISELADKNVIAGYTDGSFKPEDTVSRAEWTKMLCVAGGLSIEQYVPMSVDVLSGDWFASYVTTARNYMNYYVDSNGSYYFKPNQAASREDVTVSLVKIKSYSIDNVDYSHISKFTDSDSISNSLKKYIAVAVEKKLISGYEDNTFRGQDTLTRAEAATLLCRAFQLGSDNKTTDLEIVYPEDSTVNNEADKDAPSDAEETVLEQKIAGKVIEIYKTNKYGIITINSEGDDIYDVYVSSGARIVYNGELYDLEDIRSGDEVYLKAEYIDGDLYTNEVKLIALNTSAPDTRSETAVIRDLILLRKYQTGESDYRICVYNNEEEEEFYYNLSRDATIKRNDKEATIYDLKANDILDIAIDINAVIVDMDAYSPSDEAEDKTENNSGNTIINNTTINNTTINNNGSGDVNINNGTVNNNVSDNTSDSKNEENNKVQEENKVEIPEEVEEKLPYKIETLAKANTKYRLYTMNKDDLYYVNGNSIYKVDTITRNEEKIIDFEDINVSYEGTTYTASNIKSIFYDNEKDTLAVYGDFANKTVFGESSGIYARAVSIPDCEYLEIKKSMSDYPHILGVTSNGYVVDQYGIELLQDKTFVSLIRTNAIDYCETRKGLYFINPGKLTYYNYNDSEVLYDYKNVTSAGINEEDVVFIGNNYFVYVNEENKEISTEDIDVKDYCSLDTNNFEKLCFINSNDDIIVYDKVNGSFRIISENK